MSSLAVFLWLLHRQRTPTFGVVRRTTGARQRATIAFWRLRLAHDGSNFHDGLVVAAGCWGPARRRQWLGWLESPFSSPRPPSPHPTSMPRAGRCRPPRPRAPERDRGDGCRGIGSNARQRKPVSVSFGIAASAVNGFGCTMQESGTTVVTKPLPSFEDCFFGGGCQGSHVRKGFLERVPLGMPVSTRVCWSMISLNHVP